MSQELFLGRDQHLETLRKRLTGLRDGYRQNIALIGDELAGKTTLLYHFIQDLTDPQIIPVYIEAKDEPRISFIKRFIAILLYGFLRRCGQQGLVEDLDFLRERARGVIPRTAEKIDFILQVCQRRKRAGVFRELLGLTVSIYQETGKYSLVVFDEFHNLEYLGFAEFYSEWCNALMTQKTTMYVVASSMKYRAAQILSEDLSLLFGNFEVITVDPFDSKTSSLYLGEAASGLSLTPGVRNFIIHFTGGYPLYLKIVIAALIRDPHVEFPLLLENLLFDSSGIFHQRFSNYTKIFQDPRIKNDYLSILQHIAGGRNKIDILAHLLHKPRKDILARINYLLSLDAIARSGDFLKINDRVFSFWLRFVSDERLQALTMDARVQRSHFREAVSKMIDDIALSLEKPVTERILELMVGFGNEMLQIERRRFRLNQFREVRPHAFDNSRFREGVIGRSQECLWVLGLARGALSEEDITAFARECKKFRHNKLQRRIMVTLDDQIDSNARLRALEEKVWTWDINHINYVFDLFNKPAIAV